MRIFILLWISSLEIVSLVIELLPIAYCLFPIAYCLSPFAYHRWGQPHTADDGQKLDLGIVCPPVGPLTSLWAAQICLRFIKDVDCEYDMEYAWLLWKRHAVQSELVHIWNKYTSLIAVASWTQAGWTRPMCDSHMLAQYQIGACNIMYIL